MRAPVVKPGDDARVAWKKEEAARKANERRLIISRSNYSAVRKKYGGR